MTQGRIIWEKRARLVFFLTRRKPDPPLAHLLGLAGVTSVHAEGGDVEGAWLDVPCEAQFDELPYHLVLQIAIGVDAYFAIIRDDARADAFVRAFGDACLRLPTEAAFVCRNPSSAVSAAEVTEQVLSQEYRVLGKMTESLLAEAFSLLYVNDDLARYLPARLSNDEQPVARGRLLYGGSGPGRLF
jgi:hypothetical protein